MSANEQFVRASNRLECVESILVHSRAGEGGECILARSSEEVYGSYHTDISDSDLNVVGWRQYGKAIKTNKNIKQLSLGSVDDSEVVSPEVARCLEAFFNEMKENTSIDIFDLHFCMSTAVSALDLRYFLQNNHALTEVRLLRNDIGSVFPEESAHISTALRDVSLETLSIDCRDFINNGAFEQILLACRKVKELRLVELYVNNQVTALAELLRDPTGSLE